MTLMPNKATSAEAEERCFFCNAQPKHLIRLETWERKHEAEKQG
jgi:hypothetical protein